MSGVQATPLTRERVNALRLRAHDPEMPALAPVGLAELDALCDTALLGIDAIERLAKNHDPDRPCEKEHPELEKLCGALRSLGVPCDGFTPAADAICALRAAQARTDPPGPRVPEKRCPHSLRGLGCEHDRSECCEHCPATRARLVNQAPEDTPSTLAQVATLDARVRVLQAAVDGLIARQESKSRAAEWEASELGSTAGQMVYREIISSLEGADLYVSDEARSKLDEMLLIVFDDPRSHGRAAGEAP